ncbi:MAG: hypothetical protein IJA61_03180 [Clostridia bacterium]|nr:hypothetical protein [Clostridia bacterium]
MKYIDLYKKSNICKILTRDMEKKTLSHAYMLVLPDEVLAREYAKLFVMQLYCTSINKPCGECNNCRKISHDNFTDVHFYPKNERLTVEESRQIVTDSFVLPYENSKKIFVISNFEKSTPQSQNALLKVLEEPTDSNVFFIISDNTTQVLNTILSRVKKVVESQLSSSDLENYVNCENVDKTILNLAQGNLTKALKMTTNPKYRGLVSDLEVLVDRLSSSSDVLKFAHMLNTYKDNFNEVLDILMQIYLNKKIELCCRENDISNYSKASITKIANLIVDCKNKLKFNCNIVGIIDYLLFGILEAKYLCR